MIDVKRWGRALDQMPKLSDGEWQTLDPVAKWLIACRIAHDLHCSSAGRTAGLAGRDVELGAGSWDVTWLSLVFALGPTTVLFGKHTDKLEADRRKGVNTLPVIIGERRARYAIVGMIGAQYLLCIALLMAGSFSWPLLLVLINLPVLPQLLRVFQQAKPDSPPADYPPEVWPLWFSAHAFSHTRRFTSLFLVAVVLDTLLA